MLMWPWCVGLRGQGCPAGLNASNKLLMSPWRPRKRCWCGLGALACGVRGAQKAFGWFWRVLKGLMPGKRQAWTPVKSYWCRVEGEEKAVDVALVPWRAGSGVPKEFWMVLEGLKRGKRQAWTPVKSYWCRVEGQEKVVDVALVRWPAGSGVPKKAFDGFGGFWRVLEGLKPGKRQAWTPVKSYWCRLEGREKAIDAALVRWPSGCGVPKKLLEGFGGFEAWQTAGLNASSKLLMSLWRPGKSCWCGLGALACGVRGTKKAFGGF